MNGLMNILRSASWGANKAVESSVVAAKYPSFKRTSKLKQEVVVFKTLLQETWLIVVNSD